MCYLILEFDYPSSPYITMVGATYLDASSKTEIGATLSSGGFSKDFQQASWQTDAVEAYFNSGVALPSEDYYRYGRAYPGRLGRLTYLYKKLILFRMSRHCRVRTERAGGGQRQDAGGERHLLLGAHLRGADCQHQRRAAEGRPGPSGLPQPLAVRQSAGPSVLLSL